MIETWGGRCVAAEVTVLPDCIDEKRVLDVAAVGGKYIPVIRKTDACKCPGLMTANDKMICTLPVFVKVCD